MVKYDNSARHENGYPAGAHAHSTRRDHNPATIYLANHPRAEEYLHDLSKGCSKMFRVFLDNLADRV